MPKRTQRTRISHFIQVGEVSGHPGNDAKPSEPINVVNFSIQNGKGKNDLRPIVRHLVRETNRLKLGYTQLKYIFACVRAECEVEVPGQKGRKLVELPTADDLARFYRGIDDPVHALIFETLELTGLRCSELCNLEVARLNLKENVAFVSKGKGARDRIVVLPQPLVEKVRLHLVGRNNRYLFESNRNTRFTRRRLAQLCTEYRAKAGITKKLTCHVFRHYWNTRLAEGGITRERRALLAGNSEATQEIYTHLGVAGEIKNEVLAVFDRARR